MNLNANEKKEIFANILNILSKYNPTESALDQINKTKSMLKRELNIDDSKAKLGLETFILLYEHLPTNIKIEVKTLLDKVIFEVDETPDIVIRKKPGSIVKEDDEPIVIVQDKEQELYYEPEDYEPVGKMYAQYTPKGIKSNLAIHKEKRNIKTCKVPSYIDKNEPIKTIEESTIIHKFGVSTKTRKKVVIS